MIKYIKMPHIKNCENSIITKIFVKIGDNIQKNDKIITIESGKTSIDIKSKHTGQIKNIKVKVGNKINKNNIILNLITKKKNTKKNYNNYTKITLNKKKYISNKIICKSWKNIPHVTQFEKLNISNLMIIYNNIKKQNHEKKINLTLLPFIIKAVSKTLKQYPLFNSSMINKKQIKVNNNHNIGIVTSTSLGLITPIIKNINTKSILEINLELINNKKNIKKNNLLPNKLKNGTFSISNLGNNTNEFFTPIIKYPETAILGISRYKNCPIIKDKYIKIITQMPIALTYDHRAIDGIDSLNFINKLEKNLNNKITYLL